MSPQDPSEDPMSRQDPSPQDPSEDPMSRQDPSEDPMSPQHASEDQLSPRDSLDESDDIRCPHEILLLMATSMEREQSQQSFPIPWIEGKL